MFRNHLFYSLVVGCLFLALGSCHKSSPDPTPLPEWQDLGADSVRLNVTVRTQQGILLTGQYVNLALSADSLNSSTLVRKVATDAAGRAIFRRLYPGHNYRFNCFANYQTLNLYGIGAAFLPPVPKLDSTVVLTVY